MSNPTTPQQLLQLAVEQAEQGLAEGGVPIGAVLVSGDGVVLGAGRNLFEQTGEFLLHAETVAIREAGRLSDYSDTALVTTMVPCWYCAGLVRFLGISAVIAGDCTTWSDDALSWLAECGVRTVALNDPACVRMFEAWVEANPDVWDGVPASVDGVKRPS